MNSKTKFSTSWSGNPVVWQVDDGRNGSAEVIHLNAAQSQGHPRPVFRRHSACSRLNLNGDNPSEEEILKPVCFMFDFAPTRALRQLTEYGIGVSLNKSNPENGVKELVLFLPVLAYDGANMTQIDAGGILDSRWRGHRPRVLTRKWESALLVNVDNAFC